MSRSSRGVARGPRGRGVLLPQSVTLPSLGGQHCRRHRRRSGYGGAAPILLWFFVVRHPRAWPVRWSSALVRVRPPVATPAGAGSGGCGDREFTKQHRLPVPTTPPYAPTGSKHEPVPPVTGPVPPLTLLLAPNEAKPTQTTVIHHGAKWRILKHHMTARDLPKVPKDSQSMPRTCWACDPMAPTTPWPVIHLIARHHTHPTTHLPPQAYAWIAPWFHRTDTNPTVAWNPDHAPKWLFTTTPTCPRPNPAGVAIRYSMYEPGRTGKHEHPYYPLHHSCHTPEHRTQTLTCHDLNPDTAYILHYIYSYLTQGQPEQGLIALSPQAKHIISK